MKLFGRGLGHHVAILLATVLMVGGSAPVASPSAAASEESPAAVEDSPFVQPGVGLTSSPDPSPQAEPVATTVESAMPVVPVTGFWSKENGIQVSRIRQALTDGKLKGYRRIVVEQSIADALADELGLELHEDVRRVRACLLYTSDAADDL